MKKHYGLKRVAAILLSFLLLFLAACDKKAEKVAVYDDSGFGGSGIVGIPDLLDMVGYGSNLDSYVYDENGGVALQSKFYAPLRHSRTASGFLAKISVERKDGVFDVMTSSWNTGALYVNTENVRHRIFVVGVDDETSYIVVNGVQKQGTSNVYYERRYLVPLENYCTGAPLKITVVYDANTYYITIACGNQSVYKKIDSNTEFVETPGYSTSMDEFFEDGERVLGLESLDLSTHFFDISFTIKKKEVKAAIKNETHKVEIQNLNKNMGSVGVAADKFEKGEPVVIDILPNKGCYLDTFTVNGLDQKGAIGLNSDGKCQYTIIGIQSDQVIKATFASGDEKKYLVTGSYSYTTGILQNNAIVNEKDVVRVQAGMYTGTVKNGRFEISLPRGVYKLKLVSEKFPSAINRIVVTNDNLECGVIKFKRLNYTKNVSYNADDSLTFSAKKTTYMFAENPIDGSWVVNYTVKGASGGWFNTGGLYIRNSDGSFDYIFIFSQKGKAEVVMIESDQRSDNGPAYKTSYDYTSCTKPIQVKIAYYKGVYHVMLDNIYACTIDASSTMNTEQGTVTDEFFAEKPRSLGLRNYDSSATFTDVSYQLGDEAALGVIRGETSRVKVSAGAGGVVSLLSEGKSLPQDSIQSLGTKVTAVFTTEEKMYVDTFTINGKDSRYLLTGPFKKDGKNIYRCDLNATKGGVDIITNFTANSPKLVSVSGRYSYAKDIKPGKLKVFSGDYTGTVANGNFNISLPQGTHIITLEDLNSVYATQKVEISEKAIENVKMVLQNINYQDIKNVTMKGDSFAISPSGGFKYAELPGGITASDGFAAVYTVKGTTNGWYNGGGFYFEKNNIRYTIFVKSSNGKAAIMLLQPNIGNSVGSANYYTDCLFKGGDEELKVTVVYYKEALYIQLRDGKVYKFDSPSNMQKYPEQIDSTLFEFGYRKLGFVALDSQAVFTNVAYYLGNKKVESMFADVVNN